MVRDRLFGDVGAALETDQGNIFSGVCIDAGGWGICAREFRIVRVVAVWREWRDRAGPIHIVSPCGACRDFMLQIDPGNADTDVIVGSGRVMKLGELLPLAPSYEPLGRPM